MNKDMTKTNRWWDILVLWPFIYGALVTIMAILIAVNSSEADVITLFTGIAASLMLLSYFVTAILFFVTFVYAIHRLYTATTLDNEHKKSWLIVILIFNVFAIPFLHFMHLKK